MVDSDGGVREVTRDVLHVGLVHVPAVGRLSRVGRPVRQVGRRYESRLLGCVADQPVAMTGREQGAERESVGGARTGRDYICTEIGLIFSKTMRGEQGDRAHPSKMMS